MGNTGSINDKSLQFLIRDQLRKFDTEENTTLYSVDRGHTFMAFRKKCTHARTLHTLPPSHPL